MLIIDIRCFSLKQDSKTISNICFCICSIFQISTSAAFSKTSLNPGSCLNPPAAVKATSPSAPSKTLHCTCRENQKINRMEIKWQSVETSISNYIHIFQLSSCSSALSQKAMRAATLNRITCTHMIACRRRAK